MQVRCIVDTTTDPVKLPHGLAVPSFLIMGQGLPFDEWLGSISPDFPLALQVCQLDIHVCFIHNRPLLGYLHSATVFLFGRYPNISQFDCHFERRCSSELTFTPPLFAGSSPRYTKAAADPRRRIRAPRRKAEQRHPRLSHQAVGAHRLCVCRAHWFDTAAVLLHPVRST